MSDAEPTSKRFSDALTTNGYKLGSLLARAIPGQLTGLTSEMLGFGFAGAMRAKRSMVERHQLRVDPQLSRAALREAVQTAFDSYAKYYVESFRLPNLSARVVDREFTRDGYHNITEALQGGNGVILALPHLGGWEWAGRWMTDQGHKMTVVVEPLQPPELFEWFVELREKLGMTVVPLGPTAGSTVIKALKANGVVCLLCDRDLDRNGVAVTFFGEQTTLPAGPATIGLRSGAPVLPVAVYFNDKNQGHHAIVRGPIDASRQGGLRSDVARMTQDLADELEWLIRQAPEQWHLFQPNWPSDPGYGDEA